jgi:hypothetical protein
MTEARGRKGWFKRVAIWVIALIFIATAYLFAASWLNPGPEQPVPFSHRIHVSTKNLNCFFCHPTAATSANAGIPPVEKCLLCHNVIAKDFQPISLIHGYYNKGEGIPWVRVNRLPDFVHFSHQPHIAKRVDCGTCHGDVSQMDRINPPHQFTMGYCVDCHKENKASRTCNTCHY